MPKFCNFLARQCYKWGLLEHEEDINPLRFYFELMISQIITFLTLFLVGFIFNRVFETIIYIFIFVFLRKNIQGYHAKTFKMCYIYTLLNYLIVLYLSNLNISYIYQSIFLVMFIVVCLKKEKKEMIVLFTLYSVILIIFMFYKNRDLFNMCILICISVVLMKIVGKKNDNSNY